MHYGKVMGVNLMNCGKIKAQLSLSLLSYKASLAVYLQKTTQMKEFQNKSDNLFLHIFSWKNFVLIQNDSYKLYKFKSISNQEDIDEHRGRISESIWSFCLDILLLNISYLFELTQIPEEISEANHTQNVESW